MKMIKKQVFILLICLCLFIQITPATNKKPSSSEVSLDSITAIVNDDVITQAEFKNKVKMAISQLHQANQPAPSKKSIRRAVLQQLIDQKLQLQFAHGTGIRVSSNEINTAANHIAKQNNMTVSDLYQAAQKDGWTVKVFRKQLHDDLILQKLHERDIAGNVSISDQEINDALRITKTQSQGMPEYHVANILISLPATPSPAQVKKARSQAEAIMQKLRHGANFHQIATSKSNGEEALQGGDLGWRRLAELPDAFAKEIVHLRVGQFAGPIHTSNGFHIIKLLDERDKALKSTYEETQIQLIFLKKTKDKSDDILRTQIKEIHNKINKNTSFATLAKKYSNDETSAKGGYTGWIKPQQFNPVITTAISKLKVGEISQPISTKKGYYLIKIIAKRKVAKSSAAEKNEIEQLVFQRKVNEGIQTLINRLRNEGYVKIIEK